ncbi:MAG: hypothetical protein U0229_07630 [Anaeromyxobacter sp.]
MIQHPAVLAVLGASAAVAVLVLLAGRWAAVMLRHWDPSSGSEAQLALERRTHLVTASLQLAFFLQILSLFLFVHTAGAIAPLLVGAMCAAGVLRAGPFGYLALAAKVVGAVAAGVWLVVNRADASAPEQPLVREKYRLLLELSPLPLLDAALSYAFFAGLKPDVLTSCCASQFGRGAGLAGDLAGLPAAPVAAALYGVAGVAAASALWLRTTGRGARLLSAAAALALPVGLLAVVAFVSPYVYELPTHHCPFCLLEPSYGHLGYFLYGALLGGVVAGLGAAAVAPRGAPAAPAVAGVQRGLAAAAAACFAIFLGIVTWAVAFSGLRT